MHRCYWHPRICNESVFLLLQTLDSAADVPKFCSFPWQQQQPLVCPEVHKRRAPSFQHAACHVCASKASRMCLASLRSWSWKVPIMRHVILRCAAWIKQDEMICCEPQSTAPLGSSVIQRTTGPFLCKTCVCCPKWGLKHPTSSKRQGLDGKYAQIELFLTMPISNIMANKTNSSPRIMETRLCSEYAVSRT